MPKITIKDGKLSAEIYVQVTRDYTCPCGANSTITMDMPEGVTYNGKITVTNVNCPKCDQPVVIPEGHHYIENYKLLTK